MKLQGMSIVFALVIVPIILVLSYYISLQVDTINLQTSYDTKLLDSTYDAMSAFELNTANEDLSTVSDSLRTIIEASYNVFINNLSTNLGMSNANKSYVEPYIPAVLYTLYDGYYICTPTKVPTILTDSNGNAVAVGDEGVSGTPGNYTYNESITGIFLDDSTVGLDYGQLLYLKKGSTDTYTADINDAELEIKNVLKSYMPYSARYTGDTGNPFDLTIVYTLDNYVTIEGTIGNVYYTKSGYLIPTDSVSIAIEGADSIGYSNNINDYNQNDIETIIENRQAKFTVTINDNTNDINKTSYELNSGGQTKSELNSKLNVLNNALENAQELWYSIGTSRNVTALNKLKSSYASYFGNLPTYGVIIDGAWESQIANIDTTAADVDMNTPTDILSKLITNIETEITNTQYELNLMSSVVYYAKAYIFSNWVNEYLCNSSTEGGCIVKEDNLVEIAGEQYTTIKGIESLEFDFNTGANVFTFDGTDPVSVTEIPTDCVFYQHKMNVIQMSIQYNLNLAMTTYNNNKIYSFEYEMPVIQADEWEQILTHISITTFMQGLKCGLKTYNNYKIVSSTNNDILILPEDIYYVPKEDFNDESSEYHKINCTKLIEIDSAGSNIDYMAFSSKEVKYDKIYSSTRDNMNYEYDHKNYACYDCINDGNYFNYDSDGDGNYDAQINIFDITNLNSDVYNSYCNLRKAYYIAVGKERNDTYKMNAFTNSQGYEIIKTGTNTSGNFENASLPVSRIKAIEISIGTIYSENASISTAIYRFGYNDSSNTQDDISGDTYSVATNNSSNNSTQTITINVIPGKLSGNNEFSIDAFKSKISCENAEDIIKTTYTTDDAGNTNAISINAVGQFKSAIKYVRIIYK